MAGRCLAKRVSENLKCAASAQFIRQPASTRHIMHYDRIFSRRYLWAEHSRERLLNSTTLTWKQRRRKMNVITDEELFERYLDALYAKEERGEERKLTALELESLLRPYEVVDEESIFSSVIVPRTIVH
jgi:hypothetical protein